MKLLFCLFSLKYNDNEISVCSVQSNVIFSFATHSFIDISTDEIQRLGRCFFFWFNEFCSRFLYSRHLSIKFLELKFNLLTIIIINKKETGSVKIVFKFFFYFLYFWVCRLSREKKTFFVPPHINLVHIFYGHCMYTQNLILNSNTSGERFLFQLLYSSVSVHIHITMHGKTIHTMRFVKKNKNKIKFYVQSKQNTNSYQFIRWI